MRISVNLATQPYIELRPVYKRLRTWMLILALTGCALWFLYRSERGQAQDAVARVATVQNRVQQLESEQQHYVAMMQQPKDAAILKQSDFLNTLFRRKAFSWTATMEDLENVLPAGVQVLSIDPIVARDGHVTIHLRVTGARDRALDLIRNLEESKHFASPRLAAEVLATNGNGNGNANTMQPVSDTNQVNFDILADYRPLPLPANAEKAEKSESAETGIATTPAKSAAETKTPQAAREKAPEHRRRREKLAKPSAATPLAKGRRP